MRETDKFNRALHKYLEDNPDLDFEEAKRDFIEMYNNGEYKVEDEYEQADELYQKALETSDLSMAKDYIMEAIKICPFHFDSKCELLNIENADVSLYEDLLEEIEEYLEDELDIDLDDVEESLWLINECRPYLRTMHTAMLKAKFMGMYDKAIKFNLELLRLDQDCKLDQEFFLICCYLEANRVDEAIKYFRSLPDEENLPTHYIFLKFLAYLDINNIEYSRKLMEMIHYRNPYYFGIIVGIVYLEEEDFENLKNVDYFIPGSIEEALMYIDMINVVMEKYSEKISNFINGNEVLFDKLFVPKEKDFIVLMAMHMMQTASINELVGELRGKSDKAVTQLYSVLSVDNYDSVERRIKKLIERGYIEKIDDKQYSLSFYGFSTLSYLNEVFNSEEE